MTRDRCLLLSVVPPDHREAFRRLVVLNDRCWQRVGTLRRQIAMRYGDDASQAFRQRYERHLWQSQFAQVVTDGQIDWTKVSINRRGGTVRVQIPGSGEAYAVEMPNHRWYRIFGDNGLADESLRAIAYSERLLEACLHELDDLGALVRSKACTRAALMERIGS